MKVIGRFAVAAFVLWCQCASAADSITVTIEPDESEIMTADLKRIRPAQTAEVRFRITSPFIAQTFGNDLTAPRTRIRLIVIASARRVLSTMTGAQATGPEGPPAVMKEVDRALAGMGVTVQEFKLRYVFLSGPTP